MINEQVANQLEKFKSAMESMYSENYKDFPIENYFGGVEIRLGVKKAKILVEVGKNKSVYCFIDLESGDIYKSAGQTPAKGVRGNIFRENCDVGIGKPCDIHGAGLYR